MSRRRSSRRINVASRLAEERRMAAAAAPSQPSINADFYRCVGAGRCEVRRLLHLLDPGLDCGKSLQDDDLCALLYKGVYPVAMPNTLGRLYLQTEVFQGADGEEMREILDTLGQAQVEQLARWGCGSPGGILALGSEGTWPGGHIYVGLLLRRAMRG
eukprot:1146540-Pelagomonas_calceolata.AAC.6